MVKSALNARSGSDFQRVACLRGLIGSLKVPFPDSMRCKIIYTATPYQLLDNVNTKQTYELCGNDLFDPDFTGTGTQPQWFDQIKTLYNRYRVYGSAIEVNAFPITAGGAQTTVPVNMVVVPTGSTLASFSMVTCAGLGRSKFQFLADNTNSGMKTMNSASTKDILGVKDVEGADRLQALTTASPAERWLWSLNAQTATPTVATSLQVNVRICFDCEFFDRYIAGESLQAQSEEKKESDYVFAPGTFNRLLNEHKEFSKVPQTPGKASAPLSQLQKKLA